MDLDILKRGFKLVEYIYDSEELELHRIKEVGNGLSEKHWLGKQWLVDELSEWIYDEDIHIAAGWLGLTAYLIRKKFPKINITNSDIDPGCKVMGEFLFHDQNIDFKTLDATKQIDKAQVYINTSIEHIDQWSVDYMLSKLDKGTIVALQSNNYFSVADHVNCKNSYDEFANSLNLSYYLYTGEMEFKNHDRYMVIGII